MGDERKETLPATPGHGDPHITLDALADFSALAKSRFVERYIIVQLKHTPEGGSHMKRKQSRVFFGLTFLVLLVLAGPLNAQGIDPDQAADATSSIETAQKFQLVLAFR